MILCENVKNALDLRLCSEIAFQCQHKSKIVNHRRPRLVVKPAAKPSILMIFRGRLVDFGGTKFEAKRPRAEPLSQGNRIIKTPMAMARARLRISHAFGPRARRILLPCSACHLHDSPHTFHDHGRACIHFLHSTRGLPAHRPVYFMIYRLCHQMSGLSTKMYVLTYARMYAYMYACVCMFA